MAAPHGRPVRREQVNRSATCPMLLRVFWAAGKHRDFAAAYGADGRVPADDELRIYTWRDATLRELTELLTGALGLSRAVHRDASLSFAFVYVDRQQRVHARRVATVACFPPPQRRRGGGGGGGGSSSSLDDERTLDELRFIVGDYVDVAVLARAFSAAAEQLHPHQQQQQLQQQQQPPPRRHGGPRT